MTTKAKTVDWGGLTLQVNDVQIGTTGPGDADGQSLAHLGTVFNSYTANQKVKESLTPATAAADIDGFWFGVNTEVALGNYANAINGKLDFGTAGAVTGLGGVICAELDLGAGTDAGSYCCFEAELNCPSGASTGTRTSFLSLNAWGADVTTIDDNGFFLDLNGVTAGTSKLFSSGASIGAVDEITHGLKVNIGGSTYYILLATAANFTD